AAGGSWKLALQDGRRGKPALHTCKEQQAQARLEAAVQRIEQTKGKWGLPTGTRVVIVYEAGQEGFWIARALRALGYEVYVTDPASVAVSRQHRRAKTDRLDAIRLANALRSWLSGGRDVTRMLERRCARSSARWSSHWSRSCPRRCRRGCGSCRS